MPILLAVMLAISACTTWRAPTAFDDASLRARSVTATNKDVRLSAAVLSSEESRQLFGADVNGTGVQPVWIEVENPTSRTLWLLRSGTDPDYFSPLEVAWSFHTMLSGGSNTRIDDYFDARSFQNPIPPRTTQAGILFANPHHQTMLLNVDLVSHGHIVPFTLFPDVPDDAPDQDARNIAQRFAAAQTVDYREPGALRAALEKLPCCARRVDGKGAGEPLNMVLVGDFPDIAAALVRRNFRRSEREFDDEQQLFGRPPDVVARKMGKGAVTANWMRLWVAPLRYRGQAVFMVQAGRPVGGRFGKSDDNSTRLHPDVDEVRNLLIQDLLYSGGLAKLGFVAVDDALPAAQMHQTSDGSSYFSDGLRAALFLETRPLALSDVQLLDWEPLLKRSEARAMREKVNARNQ